MNTAHSSQLRTCAWHRHALKGLLPTLLDSGRHSPRLCAARRMRACAGHCRVKAAPPRTLGRAPHTPRRAVDARRGRRSLQHRRRVAPGGAGFARAGASSRVAACAGGGGGQRSQQLRSRGSCVRHQAPRGVRSGASVQPQRRRRRRHRRRESQNFAHDTMLEAGRRYAKGMFS